MFLSRRREPGDRRVLRYQDLQREVFRFANVYDDDPLTLIDAQINSLRIRFSDNAPAPPSAIDLGAIEPEWSGWIHLLSPLEPCEGYVGDHTGAAHNACTRENWLAFRLDADDRYRWMPIEAARAALPTVFAKALDRAYPPDLFG